MYYSIVLFASFLFMSSLLRWRCLWDQAQAEALCVPMDRPDIREHLQVCVTCFCVPIAGAPCSLRATMCSQVHLIWNSVFYLCAKCWRPCWNPKCLLWRGGWHTSKNPMLLVWGCLEFTALHNALLVLTLFLTLALNLGDQPAHEMGCLCSYRFSVLWCIVNDTWRMTYCMSVCWRIDWHPFLFIQWIWLVCLLCAASTHHWDAQENLYTFWKGRQISSLRKTKWFVCCKGLPIGDPSNTCVFAVPNASTSLNCLILIL